MWCKNCKTVVPSGASKCPVCGTAIKKSGRWTYILLAAILLAFIAGATYLFVNHEGGDQAAPEPPESADVLNVLSNAPETETPAPEATVSVTPYPEEEPTTPFPEESSVEDPLYDGLYEVLAAIPNGEAYITNKGYLYDYDSGEYVTVESMIQNEILDQGILQSIPDKPRILWLKSADLQELTGMTAEDQSKMAAAVMSETPDGVALVWAYGAVTLPRENIIALLALYDTEHGDIIRPGAEEPMYSEIARLAEMNTFSEYGYDIRYLAADDKYAVAVMTERVEGTLRTYVLLYDEVWQVALSELEYEKNIAVYVNDYLVDMDLNLLPEYDIKDIAYDPTDEVLAEAARLDTTLSFASASGNYAYAVTESGERYLGIKEEDAWVPVLVADYKEADALLTEHGASEKGFILLQE